MRELNSNFFYEIDLDSEDHIRNIFWTDARSHSACHDFGDVMSFDTTYLTNKYDMPFAPFVGINHHGQSILLGCGLLSKEDTSTFVWLFNVWLKCMSNKAPNGIVTDQCKAMQNAVQCVFPSTRHRWCLWHIMKKIPEKLVGYGNYNAIKEAFKQLVYDSIDGEAFESRWAEFINTHALEKSDWLSSLFEERERWVPCYLKNDFWAGMSSTQRSEGMNAFFDGFINSSTTLEQFVMQYDNALRQKAEKEYEADFASLNTTIPCGSQSPIERQFQNVG
ncbi:protein FAR1-RELATED SEQUENCE 5-like [Vigna unguiculata]|uniref:protein FAR1-RELATED SEQUENCE 5-like n=1 Tax=Vigna unguiculata TaxID=3917 RepID=UPI0010169060|nr:protein FAR1-RELATED SEQUENCE 5-like [Vigna unguiculata]